MISEIAQPPELRASYALIAAINGLTPTMLSTREIEGEHMQCHLGCDLR